MVALKRMVVLLALVAMSVFGVVNAQQHHEAYWQVGVGLGELPIGGSFKPSFTVGYHVDDQLYFGIVYQLSDEISRGSTSFNAQSVNLDGIEDTFETVAERLLLQCAYTPIEHGPYLSLGAVYNGEDSETMQFDARERLIEGQSVNGSLNFTQTRPSGWGAALGIGYRYYFDNGVSLGFEWTPAWAQYPQPEYDFSGSPQLTETTRTEIQRRMDDDFSSNVTNMYKIFHIGIAYRWE